MQRLSPCDKPVAPTPYIIRVRVRESPRTPFPSAVDMTRVPTPDRLGDPADWATALAAGPHYEPPYPGAVQDELAWHLVKHIREDAHLRSEIEVEVPASSDWPESGTGPAFFTLDLVVEVPVDTGAGAPEDAI